MKPKLKRALRYRVAAGLLATTVAPAVGQTFQFRYNFNQPDIPQDTALFGNAKIGTGNNGYLSLTEASTNQIGTFLIDALPNYQAIESLSVGINGVINQDAPASSISSIDSLDGSFADRRRFGDIRAYDAAFSPGVNQTMTASRLIGRSVWKTRRLLIIPGSTLEADGNRGLTRLIGSPSSPGISDILVQFQTYSQEGA